MSDTPKTVAAMRAAEMVSGVFANPGAGPIAHGTLGQDAEINMAALIADVGLDGTTYRATGEQDGGRYSYVVSYAGREAEVDMPGTTLEEVRYMKLADQNIWDFPRLYVDGNSWIWFYAVNVLRDDLANPPEQEA
jgi:hypothetical protein